MRHEPERGSFLADGPYGGRRPGFRAFFGTNFCESSFNFEKKMGDKPPFDFSDFPVFDTSDLKVFDTSEVPVFDESELEQLFVVGDESTQRSRGNDD